MGLHENNKFEEVLLSKKSDSPKLNDKHKKISILIDNIGAKDKLKTKKKPILKLGLILVIFGIICLLIINLIPWSYVIYDNKISNLKNNEIFYYPDKIEKFSNDINFTSFFESKDSNMYLGVNSLTSKTMLMTQSILLYVIIFLGVILTIIGILIARSNFPIEKYKLLNCFFAVITALICIYLIFITVKFIGTEILLFYNGKVIFDNIENLALIFISPFVLIFIASCLLKISTTILKINLKHFDKMFDEKIKNESFGKLG
jgi:hypothetical protein